MRLNSPLLWGSIVVSELDTQHFFDVNFRPQQKVLPLCRFAASAVLNERWSAKKPKFAKLSGEGDVCFLARIVKNNWFSCVRFEKYTRAVLGVHNLAVYRT